MLVALTGGIGAGKSTVLNIFEELGAKVGDTDLIVHKIYQEDKQVGHALRQRWGNSVFDEQGMPNRRAIASLVFGNNQELEWLNQLLHPLVKKHMKNFDVPERLILIAVPLLYEVNWHSEFDRVVSVWCSKENQQQRLLQRNWSPDEITSRLNAQMCQDEKLSRADFGIINDGSLKDLRQQCQMIWNKLQTKDT